MYIEMDKSQLAVQFEEKLLDTNRRVEKTDLCI